MTILDMINKSVNQIMNNFEKVTQIMLTTFARLVIIIS